MIPNMHTTDIEISEGVPYAETCTVEMPDITASTTGYTARLIVARLGTQIFVLTEGAGVDTTALDGSIKIEIEMTAAQTGVLDVPNVSYQLDLLLNGEVELRPLFGNLITTADVLST